MFNISKSVSKILNFYESDNPGVRNSLALMLGHGRLGGTGKVIILPVDQVFEHGPVRSFSVNPPAFDPYYHYLLSCFWEYSLSL